MDEGLAGRWSHCAVRHDALDSRGHGYTVQPIADELELIALDGCRPIGVGSLRVSLNNSFSTARCGKS